jgi:glycosyltransferase involved in cell wall biosynthesis|tara:strand:+ start:20 stop:1063 length:1044 start_codon:yes stop_codon:yes gene_type:complete
MPYFMKKLNPEMDVRVFVFGEEKGEEEIDGLKIYRFKKISALNTGKIIFRIIKDGNFDVIHATTLFPVAFFVTVFSKLFRIRSFLTVYGTEGMTVRGSLITRTVKYLTFILMNGIFPFSQSTNRLMLKRYRLINKNKSKVAYPCISKSAPQKKLDVRKKFNIDQDDFLVLFVGRLVERKGALDLIKAVEKTADQKIKLILVGGGEQDQMAAYVAKHNLTNQVYFAGSVEREEILNYYQAAQVFSMPSFFDKTRDDIEGLGIVYLEAQINGVPVIGTRSGGIPEAIDSNKSGFIVEPRDISALAEKIKLLRQDKELYQVMSKRAVEFVKKEFNWQKNISQHLDSYFKN